MLKKLFFLSCISLIVFSDVLAYTAGQRLSITNETDISVRFSIQIPNSNDSIVKDIAAKGETTFYMENGKNGNQSGKLKIAYTAPFTISTIRDKQLIAQGRVVFFINFWAYRYSFLEFVSGTQGLQIDQTFYCQDEAAAGEISHKVPAFDNKIIIRGNPKGAMERITAYPKKITCNGLKSSALLPSHEFEPGYTATCHDGRKANFFRDRRKCKGGLCHPNGYLYTENGTEQILNALIDNQDWKNSMDEKIGHVFCKSWSFED